MEIATKRSMNNFILYCKGWLRWTGKKNLLKELNVVCDFDGYGPGKCFGYNNSEYYNRSWPDVLEIITNHLEELNQIMKSAGMSNYVLTAPAFIKRIVDRKMLYGYFSEDLSFTELIAVDLISFVAGLPVRGTIQLEAPTYSREMLKRGFTSPFAIDKPGTTYAESNRLAKIQLA